MAKYIMVCFMLFAFFLGCKKANKAPCEDANCVSLLTLTTVSVKYASDSTNVELTSTKVIQISDGKDITYCSGKMPDNSYILFKSAYVEGWYDENVVIEFQGFINSNLVAQKQFTVSCNCCSAFIVSGDRNIYISN